MEGDELHAEGIASYSADVTWRYRRRFFCWGVAQMGGRRCGRFVCGACGGCSIGGSVFPAASARMMAGAPTAAGSRGAAPAVAGSIGGSVFPAASAGMMASAPAAAGTRGAGSPPAVVGGFGGNVFPAESAGNNGRCPCCRGDERSSDSSTGGGWWHRR